MFCKKCGFQVPEDSAFCPKCGARLTVNEEELKPTDASVTPETEGEERNSQASSANARSVNQGRQFAAGIGRILVGISLLLFCGVFLKFSGNGGGMDKYVRLVKGGTLQAYPRKTVGSAFDDYLDKPKWESGLSEDGERFVNVKGGILYFDKETELTVQFLVNEENDTFTYNASELNGIPQNNLFFLGLLESIYNDDSAQPASRDNSIPAPDAHTEAVDETMSAETADQVLFSGIPVQDLIGMTEEEVISQFGEPDSYTEDRMEYGSGTLLWASFDVSYGDTVCGFSAGPGNFSYNGRSLDQDFDTVAAILGDTYIDQGGTTSVWSAAWYYDGCQISFSFPAHNNDTENVRAVDITVYPVG